MLVPTRTTPNASDAATTIDGGGTVPVPLSDTAIVGFSGSFVLAVRLALTAPAAVGVNVMFTVPVDPGPTDNVVAPGAYLGLELAIEVSWSVAPPVFCTLSPNVFETPTLIFPKARLLATTTRGGENDVNATLDMPLTLVRTLPPRAGVAVRPVMTRIPGPNC